MSQSTHDQIDPVPSNDPACHAWRCCVGKNVESVPENENRGLMQRLCDGFFNYLRNRCL